MKRFISLLAVAMLLVTTLLPMTASAANENGKTAENVVYTISTVSTAGLKKGDTFTIKVSTNAINNIALVELAVAYDKAKVKAVSGHVSGYLSDMEMKDVVVSPKGDKDGKTSTGEVWITGISLAGKKSAKGEVIASITFKALVDINTSVSMYAVGQSLATTHALTNHKVSTVAGGVKITSGGNATGSGYPDVPKAAWYYEAVMYVSEREFMTGYKTGGFGAVNNLQRQDFVVTLARIAGADLTAYTGKTGGMSDVAGSAYYASAVAWAADKGIVTGYKNGKFGVGDTITREQVATILHRFCSSPTADNSVLKQFPDRTQISPYAKSAMAWAVQNNVISGLKSGNISPLSGASRAQIATIIMRMDQQGLL